MTRPFPTSSDTSRSREPLKVEIRGGAQWRLTIFRLLAPLGIAVCIEQVLLADSVMTRSTPIASGLLLTSLWLISWSRQIAHSKWFALIGDVMALGAVLVAYTAGTVGLVVFHEATSVHVLQ